MKDIHQKLEKFEPKDEHELNEKNQLLTVLGVLEFMQEHLDRYAEEVRERAECLFRGEKHHKRVDKK